MLHTSKKGIIFASKLKTKPINTPAQEDKLGEKTMKAFIEINTKNNRNGQIFINDQVNNMNDAYAWFDLNMDYLKQQAKRRIIANVRMYVKEQYTIIYDYTI